MPPVSPQGAFFLVLTQQGAEMPCPAAVFHGWQVQVKLSLPRLGGIKRGWGGEGGRSAESTRSSLHIHAICQ